MVLKQKQNINIKKEKKKRSEKWENPNTKQPKEILFLFAWRKEEICRFLAGCVHA
jgi:hypothetical protein